MKVTVDVDKIGELIYEYLLDKYDIPDLRAFGISERVEELLKENNESE